MNEEVEKTEGTATPEVPSKEEIVDAIKSAFKDNEEGLKLIDSIMGNLVELKKLDNSKPGSASFRMWIMFIMFLFGMPSLEQPLFGLEPTERTEDEQGIKDGESDSVEEGTQCS